MSVVAKENTRVSINNKKFKFRKKTDSLFTDPTFQKLLDSLYENIENMDGKQKVLIVYALTKLR